MRGRRWVLVSLALAMLFAQGAAAQEFVIFPSKGQSPEQLEKDKFECYGWAKGQSGFDPMAMPTATEPAPAKSDKSVAGGAVKGGIGGALLGAGIGAIAGGSKGAATGAAIGGVSGGVLGGAKRSSDKKKEEQAQQEWADQQTSQYMQKRNGYNRAYTACLEGKGYVVK